MKFADRLTTAWRMFTKGEVVTTTSQIGWSNLPTYSEVNFNTMVSMGLRRNELIYACIEATMSAVSQAKLKVMDADETEIDNHPLKLLIQAPNPYMSESDLWKAIVLYQKLAGRAIFEKVRSGSGQVVQLYPLRPDWIGVKTSGYSIDYYIYEVPGHDKIILPPEDVVDFQLFDPLLGFNPYPPVAVAARIGDADNSATDHIKQTWDSGGVPIGLIKTTQSLVPAQIEGIRALYRQRYGGHSNWNEPMILDKDAEYQQIGFDFKQLGFDMLDARAEVRICMVLGVPPVVINSMVGLTGATYNNSGELHQNWWNDKLIPLIGDFEDVLINQLAPEFDNPKIGWDYTNVSALQEDNNAITDRAVKQYQAQIITLNEAREMIGYDDIGPEGDLFDSAPDTPDNLFQVDETEDEPEGDMDDEKSLPVAGENKLAGLPPDDQMRRRFERKFQQDIDTFFNGQFERMRKAINKKAAGDVDQAFWDDENKYLSRLMRRLILAATLAGSESAMAALIVEGGIGLDWALVNEAALEYARTYGGTVARGINETTRKIVQKELANWIQSGEPLDDLIAALTPVFESGVRAEMIAVTEVTKSFAEGNIISWKESGVVQGKRWQTANDELVCPICAPLHMMVVELDADGFTTEKGDIGLYAPPAHPRCRCWLQPFVEVT